MVEQRQINDSFMVERLVINVKQSPLQSDLVFASREVIALRAAILIQELAALEALLPHDIRFSDKAELGYGLTVGVVQDAYWIWRMAGYEVDLGQVREGMAHWIA